MGGAHKNNILRSFPMSYLYCKFYTNLHKKCKTYLFLFFILSLRHYYNVIFLYGIYTWRLFWGLLNLRTNFMCIRLLFRAEFMRTGSICPWFCELFCWAVCNNMFLLRKKKKSKSFWAKDCLPPICFLLVHNTIVICKALVLHDYHHILRLNV